MSASSVHKQTEREALLADGGPRELEISSVCPHGPNPAECWLRRPERGEVCELERCGQTE